MLQDHCFRLWGKIKLFLFVVSIWASLAPYSLFRSCPILSVKERSECELLRCVCGQITVSDGRSAGLEPAAPL